MNAHLRNAKKIAEYVAPKEEFLDLNSRVLF
jgi:hypothetical protein